MKKLLSLLLVVFMVLASLTGCGEKKPSTNDTDEVNTEATGNLVIYSPNSDGEVDNVIPLFEAKYPNITVNVISDGTGNCVSRIQAEAANPACDVFWGGMNYAMYTQYPDLWEEYVSPNETLITTDAYKNKTGYYTNYGLSGNSNFILNKEKLAELGLQPSDITGYQSLLDHADVLAGHVIMGDPTASSSAWAQLKCMMYIFGGGENNDWSKIDTTKGMDYCKTLINTVLLGYISDSSSKVYKLTAQGEYAIGISYEDPCVSYVTDQEGDNLSTIYPVEGSNWTPCAASIVKNAPDMDNAKLFIDFLISTKCQTAYGENTTLRPVFVEIKNSNENMPAFSDLKIFVDDDEYVASHKTEWQNAWKEILAAEGWKK